MKGSIIIFLSTQIHITALEVFNIYKDVRVSIIIILYFTPDPLLLPQTTPPRKNRLQHFTFLLFYISHALHYMSLRPRVPESLSFLSPPCPELSFIPTC